MQLLVTAYAGLEPVESPSRDAQGESTEPDTVILRLSPRFPERAPEIESGRVYRYQDEFEFSAGTHLTHAIFIEQLAGLAGYPAVSIGLSKRPVQKPCSARLKMFQQMSEQPSLRNAS
ncbi:hypothetical protein [Burkholderia glumae]|uniref:hypothetical protein n=1 Tax=Burkholderia glumae TaxID=337 RepID=UPI0002DEB564|nr:hypothetical protein [Burkholderia glumae]AJY62459.1 hypothetical protein KS03_5746 [Burkholderia glumae LMG 2196 = ATCC 33617]QQM89327.1 hypothetical protein I6G78_00100 [Burkholderia glumae]